MEQQQKPIFTSINVELVELIVKKIKKLPFEEVGNLVFSLERLIKGTKDNAIREAIVEGLKYEKDRQAKEMQDKKIAEREK